MKAASPAELAEFDQRKAQSNADLDRLIGIWQTANLEEPEHYRLVGFIRALHDNVEVEAIAEMLGLAIARLAAVGAPI